MPYIYMLSSIGLSDVDNLFISSWLHGIKMQGFVAVHFQHLSDVFHLLGLILLLL